jgi:hypothetical protein
MIAGSDLPLRNVGMNFIIRISSSDAITHGFEYQENLGCGFNSQFVGFEGQLVEVASALSISIY